MVLDRRVTKPERRADPWRLRPLGQKVDLLRVVSVYSPLQRYRGNFALRLELLPPAVSGYLNY